MAVWLTVAADWLHGRQQAWTVHCRHPTEVTCCCSAWDGKRARDLAKPKRVAVPCLKYAALREECEWASVTHESQREPASTSVSQREPMKGSVS